MTFLWKSGIIFRELVTHTKNHSYLHFVETSHISNLLLIPELLVRPMITCL